MPSISKELIQEIRAKTGVSVMAVKKALEEARGEVEHALEILKKEAGVIASRKQGRETKSGIIQSYVHNGKIGVLVKVRCETDFVAKNPEFAEFTHELAMQIAASSHADLKALLKSPYIRDPALTVSDYVSQAVGRFGEKIEISDFSRIEL